HYSGALFKKLVPESYRKSYNNANSIDSIGTGSIDDSLPFAVTEGPNRTPLIQARYLDEYRSFTPTQILAMILSNIKKIAKHNLKMEILDCCIGIPVYFTVLVRREVLDTATIVNLNPLCLLHETTATTLAYGIYKMDLSEMDPLNVVFVDIGHANMQ
ncbi:hypothetical protein KI387_036584, partial [Taxus chinensis]